MAMSSTRMLNSLARAVRLSRTCARRSLLRHQNMYSMAPPTNLLHMRYPDNVARAPCCLTYKGNEVFYDCKGRTYLAEVRTS